VSRHDVRLAAGPSTVNGGVRSVLDLPLAPDGEAAA
jgi:hypothetical protein